MEEPCVSQHCRSHYSAPLSPSPTTCVFPHLPPVFPRTLHLYYPHTTKVCFLTSTCVYFRQHFCLFSSPIIGVFINQDLCPIEATSVCHSTPAFPYASLSLMQHIQPQSFTTHVSSTQHIHLVHLLTVSPSSSTSGSLTRYWYFLHSTPLSPSPTPVTPSPQTLDRHTPRHLAPPLTHIVTQESCLAICFQHQ